MKKLLYLIPLLIILSSLILSSCKPKPNPNPPEPPPDPPVVPKSITRAETFYIMRINEDKKYFDHGDSIVWIGSDSNVVETFSEDIETNWDENLGIITFSSENPGSSPYPTVTIVYPPDSGYSTGGSVVKYIYKLGDITISLQDVLVGTAAELNARTYRFPLGGFYNGGPIIEILERGENYITGNLRTKIYKKVYVQNRFTGEVIAGTLELAFRVCTRC